MKKVMIKVCMNGDVSTFCCFPLQSSRSRALEVAGGFPGVRSVTLGADKDRIEVTGDFDSVNLTTLLRKKVGHAEIVTAGEEGQNTEAQPVVSPCPRPEVVFVGDSYPQPGCWFL